MMTPDEKLDAATGSHRAGDLSGARRLYQQLLADAPEHTVARFRLGLLELQESRLEEALAHVRQVVAAAANVPRYHFGLGEIFSAMKRWDEAEAAYRRALELEPGSADTWFSLGGALQALEKFADAGMAYESAAQIQPDFADACNNLGNCRKMVGDLVGAESAYLRALSIKPNQARAMSNLGTVLQAQGRFDEAIELLRSAVLLEPLSVTYAINLGAVLCKRGQFTEAEPVLRAAVTREKDNPKAAFNLGNALHGMGQLRDAAEQYRKAVALRPDYPDALNNLGNVYRSLGEFKLAAATYRLAMRARPDFIPAINNAGMLLRTMGRLEEAEAILRRGLASSENHPTLLTNLGNVLKDSGRLDDAIDSYRQSLSLNPTDSATHSNLAYSLSFQAEDSAPILAECLRWNEQHAEPFRSQIPFHSNDRSPLRRLRIGYVSPDFRDHCQALFTIPLLSHHDHGGFEIFCYCGVERPDDHTRRISGYADVWRDVRQLDDAALCDLIRRDQIDILVDLTMHMADGRPLVFARKPAPIQIAWLAYPGTTGVSAIDYRFSDPRLDPPDFDSHYTERTVRLPDSFWCYDPLADQPDVNELPALSRGYLTLGCLNNPCKLTDHTLRLWSGAMRALPNARLALLAPPGSHRQHLLGRLAAHDMAPERVDFVSFKPRSEYLQAYHQIDVGLDTYPYNGHTTSLDSLWMGVPVVTRVGQTCVGRAGLSQLFQLDLLELAAQTDELFVSTVVGLAKDLPRLAILRRELRGRLSRSPLMDGPRFARNIEAAYREVWQHYCAGSV